MSVNAVYFKADWGSRFEKGATQNLVFHVDAQTTQDVPTMHQRALLPYAEDAEFQFLEIPYVEGLYSMYVLLPRQTLSVEDMVSRITVEKVVALKRGSFWCLTLTFCSHNLKSGAITMPKPRLAEMGVKRAFDSQQANFDKMIVKKEDAFRVYINKAYHDAWIEVHEEGTRAAAATTTTHYSFGCSASPQAMRAVFHADHPFLFAIVDNKSYDILFAGWIVNPQGVPAVTN